MRALELAKTPLRQVLDAEVVRQAVSEAPFVEAEGAFNLRCLYSDLTSPYLGTRCRRIYRSGALAIRLDGGASGDSGLTSEMARDKLSLVAIVDLRSDKERQMEPSPAWVRQEEGDSKASEADDSGFSVPSYWDDAERPHTLVNNEEQGSGQKAYGTMTKSYLRILATHRRSFASLLRLVARLHREKQEQQQSGQGDAAFRDGLLLHCTAGKDRTGVATALLLSLAGCPAEAIADEYSLSRVGMEPARRNLFAKLKQNLPHLEEGSEMFMALADARREDMLELLNVVEQQLGGVRGYCRVQLGLEDEEVENVIAALKAA